MIRLSYSVPVPWYLRATALYLRLATKLNVPQLVVDHAMDAHSKAIVRYWIACAQAEVLHG